MVPPYAPPPHAITAYTVRGSSDWCTDVLHGTKSKTITRCFGTKSKTSTVFLNTFVRSGGFRSSPVCRIRDLARSTLAPFCSRLLPTYRFVSFSSRARAARLVSPRVLAAWRRRCALAGRPARSPRSLAPPRLAAGRVAAARARARRGRAGPDRGCAVRCRGLSHIESALCAAHRAETIRH